MFDRLARAFEINLFECKEIKTLLDQIIDHFFSIMNFSSICVRMQRQKYIQRLYVKNKKNLKIKFAIFLQEILIQLKTLIELRNLTYLLPYFNMWFLIVWCLTNYKWRIFAHAFCRPRTRTPCSYGLKQRPSKENVFKFFQICFYCTLHYVRQQQKI